MHNTHKLTIIHVSLRSKLSGRNEHSSMVWGVANTVYEFGKKHIARTSIKVLTAHTNVRVPFNFKQYTLLWKTMTLLSLLSLRHFSPVTLLTEKMSFNLHISSSTLLPLLVVGSFLLTPHHCGGIPTYLFLLLKIMYTLLMLHSFVAT